MSVAAKKRIAICSRKGDTPHPNQGQDRALSLTFRNELSEETHVLTKQEILLGQEHGVESSRVRETRRDALLAISCFMVMGLVSGLSLPNHSDSESFLVVHALFSQDGCQQEGFCEVGRHVVPPFRKLKRVSQSLPVGGGLLGPCSIYKDLPW